ncbi:LegC family aminotransferase [Paenibacillus thermotolerans]|uniref:LegC family aminotransferase n=1 Tax=Paenibacillus thermotolerans TaxID=3027807 RepID=UPI0023674DF7|nr:MULTISPECIES: LegC family aminotransferase [unclassified Paenibacillus]
MSQLYEQILTAIKNVSYSGKENLGLHEPYFEGNEWKYVKDCIDTGWVSSVGEYVNRFERMLTEYTGIEYCSAVVNGTAALHVCLLLAGVKANDEVLVPDLTFIATANAVEYCGATPHFVDVDLKTCGIDPNKLDDYLQELLIIRGGESFNRLTGKRVRALVAMHTFGHPVDLDRILEVCNKFNIILIEDAAESLGSFYKGKHTGHWGLLSAISFNGNKVVTTGGGGAILTNDPQLAAAAKHITTTAKIPHKWRYDHDQVGYNYRLPNINAALGCAQLEQLDSFINIKRRIAERYLQLFSEIPEIIFMKEPDFAKSNYWLNAVLIRQPDMTERDNLISFLTNNGVQARPSWTLMHKLPMFKNYPRMDVSTAERIESSLINIPSSVNLGVN